MIMGGGCYSSKKHDGPKTELGGLLKGIGRVLEAAGGGFKCSEEVDGKALKAVGRVFWRAKYETNRRQN